ncbi:MAG TPA: cytochrome c [Chitinophagales bacterium]|nr:cytochrome c [Chitinophagales bacterium]
MKLHNIKEGIVVFAVISLIVAQASCYYPKTSPGWEYMPDMANAITYETYSSDTFFSDSMEARQPVPGTIPRGIYEPFHFSPNLTGYDSAGMMLHFPSWLDTNSLADASHLFNIYCAVCHGFSGKGDGSIVKNDSLINPFPPPPPYFDDAHINLPEGKMYYSVHYGKNLMGPYSKVLDHNQVWKVVYYVKSLQHHYQDSVATALSKAAATTAKADTVKKK